VTPARNSPLGLPLGSETILVVEDKTRVRSLAVRMLQRLGYTVLEAPTGSEGMSLSRDYVGAIHLVLADVIMPGMTGLQMVERLRKLHSDILVLYMSGYFSPESMVRHGLPDPDTNFIQKPFTLRTLAHKVRRLLDVGRVSRE